MTEWQYRVMTPNPVTGKHITRICTETREEAAEAAQWYESVVYRHDRARYVELVETKRNYTWR